MFRRLSLADVTRMSSVKLSEEAQPMHSQSGHFAFLYLLVLIFLAREVAPLHSASRTALRRVNVARQAIFDGRCDVFKTRNSYPRQTAGPRSQPTKGWLNKHAPMSPPITFCINSFFFLPFFFFFAAGVQVSLAQKQIQQRFGMTHQ